MGELRIIQKMNGVEPDTGIVSLCGSMTIEHGEEIRNALLKAIEETSTMELNLEAVTAIDLTGLQFVCTLHRTAVSGKKQLTVKGNDRGVITEAAHAAGFFRHVGCVQDIEHTCIWIEGGT